MPLSFPGLSHIHRWSFPLSHGVTPSVCLVDVVPQAAFPNSVGTLQITTANGVIEFANVAIDRAAVRRSPTGTLVGLALYDRRWKWRFGDVSGWYNLRTPKGDLEPTTEKSPRELAALLLDALGETDYSTADLPDDVRPEVHWDHASPAVELDRLCELLGCRVVLGVDDRVALRSTGMGEPLPDLGVERRESVGIDPPARPSAIRIVGDITRFQTRFRLEAVGEERDGSIVPIDSLSYRPAAGWGAEPPCFGNVPDATDRVRARKSVFRWYRIRCTAPNDTAGQFQIPGNTLAVTALWQILPLLPGLVQTETNAAGFEQPRPPVVDGVYYPWGGDGQNVSDSRRVPVRWTLDHDRGMVRFQEALVRRTDSDLLEPAELYLTVAHPVRRSNDRQPLRYVRDHALSGAPPGAGAWVIRRPELRETVLGASLPDSGAASQNSANPTRNTTTLNAMADALAGEAEAEVTPQLTADIEYVGLIAISPDGAIQQVEWREGPEGATTRASRNSEFATSVAKHAVRREARRGKGE